jgi:hypothetical protein
LEYADQQPIRSPAKGNIYAQNPDFEKIMQELQHLDSDEDENIME